MMAENDDGPYCDFTEAQRIEKFKKNLALHLEELEMLQAMFSNPGEFHLYDPSLIADYHDFLNHESFVLPSHLEFAFDIKLDGGKLESIVGLPLEYPDCEPDVFVRSENLKRDKQHELNEGLMNYISTLERGEICIGLAVQWLMDHGEEYFIHEQVEQPNTEPKKEVDLLFTRYWIYSHHIYNKIKRRTILEIARESKLTGFCLPGKPGIICVEGLSEDCADFWSRVKHMNWKKIMCKKREEVKLENEDEVESHRRFLGFEEICFTGGKQLGRDCHMDMGEFLKYLEEHHSGYVFRDYFGIDGRVCQHS